MGKAAGYILKIASDRRDELLEEADESDGFAEAVPSFQHSRNLPLVCFVSFEHGSVTHLAMGRRGVRAATGRQRLNVFNLVELRNPIEFGRIRNAVSPRVRQTVTDRLRNGGLLPPGSFSSMVEALSELSDEASLILERFARSRRERIAALSPEARNILAEQKEALLTAMEIAGIDRRQVADWQPPAEFQAHTSYLDGLETFRSREDAMVQSDWNRVPGFDRVRDLTHGSVVFENEFTRLTVTIANHLPLEEQLGVDLIYYNETFNSFVMVQYKAMEQIDEEDQAVFRFPSPQLDVEVARMDNHLAHIRRATAMANRANFRFSDNPFFLKFCPRLVFNPENVGLVPGMYLPLDYWKLCAADLTLVGRRGGRILTYANVGRHLNNSEFVQLVRLAWVGTNAEQSAILIPLIREVVQSGRTVALAVEADVRDPDDPASAVAEDWQQHDEGDQSDRVQISS